MVDVGEGEGPVRYVIKFCHKRTGVLYWAVIDQKYSGGWESTLDLAEATIFTDPVQSEPWLERFKKSVERNYYVILLKL